MKKLFFTLTALALGQLSAWGQSYRLPSPFENVDFKIRTHKNELWDPLQSRWRNHTEMEQTMSADCRLLSSKRRSGGFESIYTDSSVIDYTYDRARITEQTARYWDRQNGRWRNDYRKKFGYPSATAALPNLVTEEWWNEERQIYEETFRSVFNYQNGRLVGYKEQIWARGNVYLDVRIDTMTYAADGKIASWRSRDFNVDSFRMMTRLEHRYLYANNRLIREELRDTNDVEGGFFVRAVNHTHDPRGYLVFSTWLRQLPNESWTNVDLYEYENHNAKGRPQKMTLSRWVGQNNVAWEAHSVIAYQYQNDTILTESLTQRLENGRLSNVARDRYTYCAAPTTRVSEPLFEALNLSLAPNPAAETVKITSDTEGPTDVLIFNSVGQMVKMAQKFDLNAALPVHDLPNGYYHLKLISGAKTGVKPLVIAR